MGVFDRLFRRLRSFPDGSSVRSAIVVGSVGEEYAWIEQNRPGYQLRTQSLQVVEGKAFDVLTCRNDRGEEQTLFFDISGFYERRKTDAGVPCPYCGSPLRTDKAKQCFKCGMDWRDPANVVCRKRA